MSRAVRKYFLMGHDNTTTKAQISLHNNQVDSDTTAIIILYVTGQLKLRRYFGLDGRRTFPYVAVQIPYIIYLYYISRQNKNMQMYAG